MSFISAILLQNEAKNHKKAAPKQSGSKFFTFHYSLFTSSKQSGSRFA